MNVASICNQLLQPILVALMSFFLFLLFAFAIMVKSFNLCFNIILCKLLPTFNVLFSLLDWLILYILLISPCTIILCFAFFTVQHSTWGSNIKRNPELIPCNTIRSVRYNEIIKKMGQDNFDIGEAKKLLKCSCGCLDFDIEKVKWRAPPLQQAPVFSCS